MNTMFTRHLKGKPAVVVVIALVFSAGMADAATRKVCYRIRLADGRENCATSSETGARRPCKSGGYVDTVGHYFEVWDKDSGSGQNDDYIGTWVIGGAGSRCVTFEWEGAAYSGAESHPDIYLRYINKVRGTKSSTRVRAVDTDGSSHPVTSWRNGGAGDPDRYVATNCTADTTCRIFPSGFLVPTNDRSSERGLRIMALDSAQHALQIFGKIMDKDVKMRFPGKSSCPTSCAVSRKTIHIAQSRGDNGFNVAHELGHVVQMQEFNQDKLRCDCSRNGAGHSLTSIEHESCATAEGWADFVGVVSWYNPNKSGTTPMAYGRNFEAADPHFSACTSNAHNELQVAKAFWDLDDKNNEASESPATGADRLSYGTTYISKGWDRFPNGNGNRQDYESGRDGVNMRDYYQNNITRFGAASRFFETLIRHNCLNSQTND